MGPSSSEEERWRERPVLGAALQAALVGIPLLAGIGAGLGVGRWVGQRTGSGLMTWMLASATATLIIWLLQPVVHRMLPLAWLLRLGMLWPGQAPSRFKVARDAGRIGDLEDRLWHAREAGLDGEPEHVAESILTLTAALTAHDRKTRGHAERVRIFTELAALELSLPQADQDRLRWAALLHDIGKLEVPERVLNKPGKPSPSEWEQLRSHPEAGQRLLGPLGSWLGEWADATLHHHERWDGTGYPHGLSGAEVSRAGRIVAVADAYEVMTAARSYKRPMSAAAARRELVACAGTQFDPAMVRAFLLIPVWRLRWALGPFAWVAQLPLARNAVHASSSLTTSAMTAGAGAVAAGAAAIAVGSTLQPASTPEDSVPGWEIAQDDAQGIDVALVGAEVERSEARVVQREPLPRDAVDQPDATDSGANSEDDDPVRDRSTPSDGSADDGGTDERRRDDDDGGSGDTRDKTDHTSPDPGDAVDDTTDSVDRVLDDTKDTTDKIVDDTKDTTDTIVDDTKDTTDKIVEDVVGGTLGL